MKKKQLQILQLSTLRLWDWIHASSENSGKFSDQALSLRGKWRSIQSWLPWRDENADKEFLEELFHQQFFHPADLEGVIREEWIWTQLRWDEEENLLVIQEGALYDSYNTDSIFLSQTGEHTIHSSSEPYQGLPELERVQSRNQQLALQSAGQLVVSEIASEIAARALTRVAISMGILTTGAGSSAYTFGAGALLGLIVDQCYSWIQNPEKELEAELIQALDMLADEVTDSYRRLLQDQLKDRMMALRENQ